MSLNKKKIAELAEPRSEKSKENAEMRMLEYELKKKDEYIELLNLRISEKDTKLMMLESFLKDKEKMLADNDLTQFTIKVSAIIYVIGCIILCAFFYLIK